jgi:hypothetical protein
MTLSGKHKKKTFMKENNAAFITFDKINSPIKTSGLNNNEIDAVKKPYDVIASKRSSRKSQQSF